MRWTKTDPEALSLEGVAIEGVYENKTLKSVILKQGDTTIRLSQESYSQFTCFVPEVETSHVVSAKVAGIPVSASFSDDKLHEAQSKARELEKAGAENVVISTLNGKVVANDEIPF